MTADEFERWRREWRMGSWLQIGPRMMPREIDLSGVTDVTSAKELRARLDRLSAAFDANKQVHQVRQPLPKGHRNTVVSWDSLASVLGHACVARIRGDV